MKWPFADYPGCRIYGGLDISIAFEELFGNISQLLFTLHHLVLSVAYDSRYDAGRQ